MFMISHLRSPLQTFTLLRVCRNSGMPVSLSPFLEFHTGLFFLFFNEVFSDFWCSFVVLGNHDYRGNAVAQLDPILRDIDKRWLCLRSFMVNTGEQAEDRTSIRWIYLIGVLNFLFSIRYCAVFLHRHYTICQEVLEASKEESLWLERSSSSKKIHFESFEGTKWDSNWIICSSV